MQTKTIATATDLPNDNDRLYQATRAWLLWLQGLHSTRPKGSYRWHPNEEETDIIITDQNPDKAAKTNKRPIISTSRGPATYMSSSTSQVMTTSLFTRGTTYTDIIATSVVISVVAREGIEAQGIAYTIFRMLPVFKASICRLGGIHQIGNNVSISPEAPLLQGSSTPEWQVVRITIPFFIQDVIETTEDDFHSMLKRVNLHMGLTD